MVDNDDGTTTPIASATFNVYDVTHAAALADVASDANGIVPAGTVTPAAGTLIRFSYHQANGICGYAEVLTT
jgi:hypothetical protein